MKDKKRYVGINLEENIFAKISKEANEQHRSISSQIAYILQRWVDQEFANELAKEE